MPLVADSAALIKYLPDWKAGKREVQIDFLWTIVHHVQPNFAKKCMEEALK